MIRILILGLVLIPLLVPGALTPSIDSWWSVAPAAGASLGHSLALGTSTQRPPTCTSTSAGASPASVAPGTNVVISAYGFQPPYGVTVTYSGPTAKTAVTTTPDNQCRISLSVPTTGDAPGTYRAALRGASAPQFGDGTITLNVSWTVVAATPTYTPSPTATTPPVVTCPTTSAAMLSQRLAPGQNATVIGRGFQPGSVVQIEVDGPTGRLPSPTSPTAGNNCEAIRTFPLPQSAVAGSYTIILRGSNGLGAPVNVQVDFDVLGETGPSPTLPPNITATSTPFVAGPTPTLPLIIPSPTATVPVGLPPLVAPGLTPLLIDQSVRQTGGSFVPIVGVATEYEHLLRITNTGSGIGRAGDVPSLIKWPLAFGGSPLAAMDLVMLLQGDTLVLRTATEYAADTRILSSNPSTGTTTMQGRTLVWEGRLPPGETLSLSTNLQQIPTQANVANEVVSAQTIVATNPQGRSVTVPPPPGPAAGCTCVPPPPQRYVQPPPPPVDPATGSRFFADTGFSVADEDIWLFYVRRGGQRTFGAPISRLMLLNGAWIQIFEKGILQVSDGGRVASVNLLEEPYLPFESIGDLTLPVIDGELVAVGPDPAAANFAAAAQDYVKVYSPEQFEGLNSRFYTNFLGTVRFSDAFFDGRGDPNLLPGFNLEIWGLPTSRPAFRQLEGERVDTGIALLRYQRGVMIHDARAGTTTAAPLGYYVRSILAGDESQTALALVARSSPFWGQYDPDALDWVARPEGLAETNLVLVFTREDGAGEAVPTRARPAVQLLLEIVRSTPTYDDGGEIVGNANPGQRYRVLQQVGGRVQVVLESDPSTTPVWVELDERVRATIG